MTQWFWYAVGAAVLYGLHQVFTKLAAERIGDGLGGLLVEISAALTIALYLAALWLTGRWEQKFSSTARHLLRSYRIVRWPRHDPLLRTVFRKVGLSRQLPMILAGGAAIMAIAGILFFKETRFVGNTCSASRFPLPVCFSCDNSNAK
jgi:transporter family protein